MLLVCKQNRSRVSHTQTCCPHLRSNILARPTLQSYGLRPTYSSGFFSVGRSARQTRLQCTSCSTLADYTQISLDNKHVWGQLIELYVKRRCSWVINSGTVTNNHALKGRAVGYLEKSNKIYPDCDKTIVKLKFELMKASFRRQLKKVQTSKNRPGVCIQPYSNP